MTETTTTDEFERVTFRSTEPLEQLREPFPRAVVGLLPKPFRKDAPKGDCDVCGKYHGLPAAHLDYIGHAAVTDRFLTVDINWNWEPFAVDEQGLPALDAWGNLWVRLTIAGVTRIGVGDGPNMKERIGDALRNAAMRFGVALSLWTKEELESGNAEEKPARAPRPRGRAAASDDTSTTTRTSRSRDASGGEPAASGATPTTDITTPQVNKIRAMLAHQSPPITGSDDIHEYVAGVLRLDALDSLKSLTKGQASKVIDQLNAIEEAAKGADDGGYQ